MKRLIGAVAAFLQEWKTTAGMANYLAQLAGILVRSAALAWIVRQTGDQTLMTYVYVGIPLISIWFWVVFQVGWSLSSELTGRTLDFNIISRTPIMFMMLGKTLTHVAFWIPAGIISFLTVLLVSGQLPEMANAGTLPLSLLLVIVGLVATSLFFAPLVVLVGGAGGFFNAIMPIGAALSGFILPVNRLPFGLEVVARCFPTSWAMESIWAGIEGPGFWGLAVRGWSMAILLSAVWLIIDYLMCNAVEKRIRITGTLGIY